jgi:hypothetical protein
MTYGDGASSGFDTVKFESVQSLETVIAGRMIPLHFPFEIEVENWDGETKIPGYSAEPTEIPNVVRLRQNTEVFQLNR